MNKELDVHGLDLLSAIKVITREVQLAFKNGKSILYINHGFNHGVKIKNWCKNHGLELKHVIKVESGINEGITIFYLKCNYLN